MWQMAIPAAINLAGGLLGSRSAKKAANQQAAARERQAGVYEGQGRDIEGAYNQYGQNMFGFSEDARNAYQFNPIAMRSPFGSVSYQNGELVSEMSPEASMLMGQGNATLSQAGMFDQQGAQDAYFNNLQRMYGSARDLQSQSLLRTLQSKGMAGLGSNVNGNMLMKGMMSGWQDQDLAASKMSMDYGGNELDRLYNRGYGMLNQAGNMTNNAFNQWVAGQGQANPFQMGGAGAWFGAQQAGFRAPLEGVGQRAGYMTNAANIRAGGQVNQAASNDAANQGMIRGFVNAANSLPWGSMFGGAGAANPVGPSAAGTYMGYAPYQSPY